MAHCDLEHGSVPIAQFWTGRAPCHKNHPGGLVLLRPPIGKLSWTGGGGGGNKEMALPRSFNGLSMDKGEWSQGVRFSAIPWGTHPGLGGGGRNKAHISHHPQVAFSGLGEGRR